MADGLLSLSWNNHSSTFCHMLSTLREVERYTDVTVACDGKFYPVHKLVLSTCSDYFQKMFERTPCKHPIIVLKDIQCREIEALLSYMYDGVVNVAQNDLSQLIKAAELLQIKGLAVPDEPPQSNKKASHSRGSTEDNISPHPKRQRREESSSTSFRVAQTASNHISSLSSPSQRESDTFESTSTQQQDNRGDPKTDHRENRRSERNSSGSQENSQRTEERTDNQASEPSDPQQSSEKSNSEVKVMDESVIKEEIMDPSVADSSPDASFNYGSLTSDLGMDGGVEGGAPNNDHSLSIAGSYDRRVDNPAYDAHPGPSGLQWSGMNESDVSNQGYCGDLSQDLNLMGQPDSHQQQAHHMVNEKSDTQWSNEGEGIRTSTSSSKDSELLQCPYCPYSSHENQKLIQHICTSQHRTDFYSCTKCPYSSPLKSSYITHLRSHVGEKVHKCPHCPYISNFGYNLKVHMRSHTGEKPFACALCPLRFIQKAHLKYHLYSHTGERPFQCSICSVKFKCMSSLKRHLRVHNK